jgi:hypothetical protein
LAPLPAGATPLGLSSTHPGDVTTHYTDVHYTLDGNGITGSFVAEGYPDQFDVNNQNIEFNGGNFFSLTMTVNQSNGALVGGSLTITGDTDGLPFYGGTLLTGNVIAFGFPNGPFGTPAQGNIFEFQVHVTGGSLYAPYYSATQTAGIIMNIANETGPPFFSGVFTSPFHNDGYSGLSDTFPTANPIIPEPASIVLLGAGLVPLAWRLRRRGRPV